MHNKTKTALILFLVLAIVGVGCVGAGIALGGKLSFRIDFKNRTVVADNSALVTGELTPEPFTTLELNVSTADVSVQRGDRWELRYALEEEPTIVQENGTLRLTAGASYSRLGRLAVGGGTSARLVVDAAPATAFHAEYLSELFEGARLARGLPSDLPVVVERSRKRRVVLQLRKHLSDLRLL